MRAFIFVTGTALALFAQRAGAEEIRVAVASNFTAAAGALAQRFESRTGHKVTLISGSTGKHYAQIVNGAPFDVFLAADVLRPQRLEKDGAAVSGSRFTYAIGRVVVWSPRKGFFDSDSVLKSGEFRHLAIANPDLAPYGKAAREILRGLGMWNELSARLVRGENIGQAFQFVKSGNAELGFVAYAQVRDAGGSMWEAPRTLYTPIEQQAVLLRDTAVARAFLSFVRDREGREMIRAHGYDTP